MPELPHVEQFVRYLGSTSLHREIGTVHLRDETLLTDVSESTLRRHLLGHRLVSSRRHGKHLFAETDGDRWLRLHFGMTGELEAWDGKGSDEQLEHVALLLDFDDDRRLAFRCQRRFGEIGLVRSPESYVESAGLGPDALSDELDLESFKELMEDRRGTLKGALMNQELLAGIGNEYADEILFHAGIHPAAQLRELSDDRLETVYRTMRKTLEEGIDAGGEPPDSFLLAHREEGAKCPSCGGPIEKMTVVGRPTYFCPREQKKPD